MVPKASTMVAPRIIRVFFISLILSGIVLILGWMPRFDVAAIYIPVSLFAGILHDGDVRLEGPGFSNSPGSGIGFRIVHGVRVLGMAVVDAPECVGQARLVAELMADRIDSHVAVDGAGLNGQVVSLTVPHGLADP